MYKYMSSEVAPLFAATLRVRFTQPSGLNDPFEFRPLIDFEGTAIEIRDIVSARLSEMFSTPDRILAYMEELQAADPKYPATIVPIHVFREMVAASPELGQKFMAEMQQHKAEVMKSLVTAIQWEALWENFQQSLGQTFGIFSLTEDATHPVMWSHYASQHYGIVVELDETHPWFEQKLSPVDELRHLVKVAYVQNPHARTWKQLNGLDVLYTKNSEWAYEKEWRIIRPLKDGTETKPGIVCFDIPATAVRRIIFGCRTNPDLEADIRAAVKVRADLNHIAFKRAKLIPGGKIKLVGA
jgi:Protein of unknown function (DUF2971)